jgi:hypothetical protein
MKNTALTMPDGGYPIRKNATLRAMLKQVSAL